MTAPQAIIDLVERYEQNRESYRASTYSESEIRTEFIDPFCEALGWDIANKAGDAEQYKDVVREASVEVEGKAKKPDYEFRIGGTRKFYVEAKKPAVNLEDDAGVAFQIRRYSWSAKLPLGILTNFGEFAIYDCRNKPKMTDKAGVGRLYYFTHKDYLDKWDEIASIFSRNAIRKGAFDRYAISDKKRGTQTVDEAFLADIEDWREKLAKNIAIRNMQLTVEELNYSVQQTIDRIIFLRICEDRGIESYGDLKKITSGKDVYKALMKHFLYADERYDSGLFHFKKEKDVKEDPDDLTPSLKIDDAPLKDIVKHLYYPTCPYEFSVISADILGQVYERFLGKVIRLTPSHQAKVEEKPEVKKAGGVYYTPTYIVDYIVKNTVGKLVEDKTPSQVDKFKILDPACGSGSFLIGAYQYLLDWYLDCYTKHDPVKIAKGKAPKLYQSSDGWRLTLPERRRILLNNIHGVDIDGQAVEVTKLSLWLKVLEGETQRGFHRILPDLSNNIKCGNSLIGTDYFAEKLVVDPIELAWINPMDWDQTFPEIMKSGGFDAVIGNPPYVRMETFVKDKPYFKANYRVHADRGDFFFYFVEKSYGLLRKTGRFGFIVSNSFVRSRSGESLREFIRSSFKIQSLAEFGDITPFQKATVYPIILIMSKDNSEGNIINFSIQDPTMTEGPSAIVKVLDLPQRILGSSAWVFEPERSRALRERLLSSNPPLKQQYGPVMMGVKSGLNEAFIIGDAKKADLVGKNPKLASIIKPYIRGQDIDRWRYYWQGVHLIYISHGTDLSAYPEARTHLQEFRVMLEKRATHQKWYELQQPQTAYARLIERPKIVFPDMSRYPKFCLDKYGMFFSNTVYFISTGSLFLLGLLNSSVTWFIIRGLSNALRGGLWRFRLFSGHIERIPIPRTDTDVHKTQLKENIEERVKTIMGLQKQLDDISLDNDKVRVKRQIHATERQIDQLVYELYGLTDEEIKIVEGVKQS